MAWTPEQREKYKGRSKEARRLANKLYRARHRDKHRAWNKASYERNRQVIRPKPSTCEVCDVGGLILWNHNHETGKHRGWLCTNCNLALDNVKDSTGILQKLIKYLEENQ